MGRFAKLLAIGLMGGILMTNICVPVQASDKEDRIDRQVRMFERIMDQMLVDSPNFLVQSSEPTLGYYDEGRGAMFRFRASLVGYRGSRSSWSTWTRHIFSHDDDDWDDDDDDYDRKSRKKSRDRELKAEAKQYPRGKEEIIETLADYGALLRAMGDNEWVTVQVRLRGAELFDQEDIDRLIMKVKMSDIRAYDDGSISGDQFAERVQVSED